MNSLLWTWNKTIFARWIFQNEQNTIKVLHSRSASKKMFASYFRKSNHARTVVLKNHWAMITNFYAIFFSQEIIDELRKQCKLSQCISNYQILKRDKIDLMTHCLYSPDLAPNNFSLLPFIKIKILVTDLRWKKLQLKSINHMFLRYKFLNGILLFKISLFEWKSV